MMLLQTLLLVLWYLVFLIWTYAYGFTFDRTEIQRENRKKQLPLPPKAIENTMSYFFRLFYILFEKQRYIYS